MLLSRHIDKDRQAPELFGSYWFNTPPIALRELHGSVVALFFWDHTSMNSLRAIRHMNRLHERYRECGLTVIGVQVAQYAVVTDPSKKEKIIRSCGITFPVVADDERVIADSYRIETIPSVCLVAPKGDIYDIQAPKGSFSRTERSIQYLLRQAGYYGDMPFVEYVDDRLADYPVSGMTHDFDLGYLHGSLGNTEGYNPELPAEYHDPYLYVEGKFYAHGIWIAGKNSFEFAGEGNDGYILFPYTGSDVDIVTGTTGAAASVEVLVDDKPVETSIRGGNIIVDTSGSTTLKIKALTSAHLINNKAVDSHTVKLIPSHKGAAFYRVSFAPYEEPLNETDEADQTPFRIN